MPELPKSWQRMREAELGSSQKTFVVEDPEELERLRGQDPLEVAARALGSRAWENLTHPKVPETPEEMMKATIEGGALPLSMGMLAPYGIGKAFGGMMKAVDDPGLSFTLRALRFEQAQKRGKDLLTVPMRNWRLLKDITTEPKVGSFYRSGESRINIDPTGLVEGSVPHEFGHLQWYKAQGKFEQRIVKALQPVHKRLNELYWAGDLPKGSDWYWRMSPSEQTSMLMSQFYDEAWITGQTPQFKELYRRALQEAPGKAVTGMQEFLDETMKGRLKGVSFSTAGEVEQALNTTLKFIRGGTP